MAWRLLVLVADAAPGEPHNRLELYTGRASVALERVMERSLYPQVGPKAAVVGFGPRQIEVELTPDEIAALAGVAQAVIALLTLIATIVVTVFVYYGTRAIARVEHDRGIRDAWNTIDSAVLSDPAMLAVAESLLPSPGGTPGEADSARRRWLAYMVLNVLSSTYSAARRGLTRSSADSLATCEYHLGFLVRHDDIYALTQEGYSTAFAAFCREVRGRQARSGPPPA